MECKFRHVWTDSKTPPHSFVLFERQAKEFQLSNGVFWSDNLEKSDQEHFKLKMLYIQTKKKVQFRFL